MAPQHALQRREAQRRQCLGRSIHAYVEPDQRVELRILQRANPAGEPVDRPQHPVGQWRELAGIRRAPTEMDRDNFEAAPVEAGDEACEQSPHRVADTVRRRKADPQAAIAAWPRRTARRAERGAGQALDHGAGGPLVVAQRVIEVVAIEARQRGQHGERVIPTHFAPCKRREALAPVRAPVVDVGRIAIDHRQQLESQPVRQRRTTGARGGISLLARGDGLAGAAERHREVAARLLWIAVEPQRVAARGQRGRQLPQSFQRIGATAPGRRLVGHQRAGAVERGQRGGAVLDPQCAGAKADPGTGVAPIGGLERFEVGCGRRHVTAREVQPGAGTQRRREARIERERRAVGGQRGGGILRAFADRTEVEVGQRARRLQRHQLARARQGAVDLAAAQREVDRQRQRFAVVGVAREGGIEPARGEVRVVLRQRDPRAQRGDVGVRPFGVEPLQATCGLRQGASQGGLAQLQEQGVAHGRRAAYSRHAATGASAANRSHASATASAVPGMPAPAPQRSQ